MKKRNAARKRRNDLRRRFTWPTWSRKRCEMRERHMVYVGNAVHRWKLIEEQVALDDRKSVRRLLSQVQTGKSYVFHVRMP